MSKEIAKLRLELAKQQASNVAAVRLAAQFLSTRMDTLSQAVEAIAEDSEQENIQKMGGLLAKARTKNAFGEMLRKMEHSLSQIAGGVAHFERLMEQLPDDAE